MSQTDQSTPETRGLPDVFGATAEQGRDLLAASLRTWVAESRAYVDDLAKDGAEALEGFSKCRTPFDVLIVEQHWLMARSKSWFDASLRLFAGALHEAESAAAEGVKFRLPE